ncbi:VOC family protein [Cellulomonas soli]
MTVSDRAPTVDGMEQRLSLVTLGVADVPRAHAFYAALGWRSRADLGNDEADIVFIQAGGIVVALWSRAALAEDTGVSDTGGWGGITLAHNVRSPAEVDAVLQEAVDAGATLLRAGAATFWGGYNGLFADPDGHCWEIAHNPSWPITEDGRTLLAP